MSLLKNSSIYTIGNFFPAVAGFLLLPVYSRYLSPEEYGVLASMEVLAYLYGVFVNLNLERASYRFYFDREDEQWRKDLFFTIHYSSISLAVFWMIVAFLLQDIITLAFPSIPFWPIYVLVLGRVSIDVILTVPQQYFQVVEKAIHFVSISLIRSVSNILLVLWFLLVREDGVQGVLTGSILASIIMIPIGFYISKKYFNGTFRKKVLVDSMQFAWPFIPTLIVAWVVNLSDRIFLEYFASQTQLGIYGMAYKIASAYFILMRAYHTAYLPRYFKYANMDDQIAASNSLEKDAKINVAIHIIICFMMILWAPELVYYLLPSDYNDVVHIMRILLISHLFAAIIAVTFSPALLQAKKVKVKMVAAIATSIINVVLNFFLIPKYGMYGAAIATVISMISLFTMQYFVSRLGYVVIFPWRILLISIAIGTFIVYGFEFLIDGNFMIILFFKLLLTIILISISYHMILNVTRIKKDTVLK